MELHLKIAGFLLTGLALFHIPFPKYFNWKKDLSALSLINRQMMTTHTFFIALTVFLMGLYSLTQASEIINTRLGRITALGMGSFWAIRFVFQHFVYSPKLWRGKRFETAMHLLFTIIWTYLCFVYFKVYFG